MTDYYQKRVRLARARTSADPFDVIKRPDSICCCRAIRRHAGSDSGMTSTMVKKGLASLPDHPRCGAPSKLNEAHRSRLKEWIDGEPLTCRVLVNRLVAECGITISASTLRNELKRTGYLWKRTRYSLKKARSRTLRASPARHCRTDRTSASERYWAGLRRRSRVCTATTESFSRDEKRRNPCCDSQTHTAIERDRRYFHRTGCDDGAFVSERQWRVVLWLFDGSY